MRLLLAIPSLRCGGAERTMSILAEYWVQRGHEVSLATFEPPETDFFQLDPGVRRYVLGGTRTGGIGWLRANRARLSNLRAAIRESRPHVVLSFLYTMNLLAIMAGRRLAPVVVAERTDPRYFRVERWQAALRRLLYPAAAAIVVQTRSVLDGWGQSVARGVPVFSIPNPVLSPIPAEWDGPKLSRRVVAAVGRLDREKGCDVLVDAFARAAGERAEWSLVMLGSGPERDALAAQISGLGLRERVLLPGIGDSAALFARAEVFATATRLEGFPNALLEAMASGLPVVATDCPSGPREIVRDGVDGYLVPVDDRDSFAAALGRLLQDEDLRRRYGAKACEVLDRFGIDKVGAQWEAVFRQVGGQLDGNGD